MNLGSWKRSRVASAVAIATVTMASPALVPAAATGSDAVTVTVVGRGRGDIVLLHYFEGSAITTIPCGGDGCTADTLNQGEPFWVTVEPGDWSAVVGFSGSCRPESDWLCLRSGLEPDSSVMVSLVGATVTVETKGTGVGSVTSSPGSIDCGSVCSDIFAKTPDATVTLTAHPGLHSSFIEWGGVCAEQEGRVCTLYPADETTLGSPVHDTVGEVTAAFGLLALTVKRGGRGSGRVAGFDPDTGDALLDCGILCTTKPGELEVGDQVELTAQPAAGDHLSGWAGGGCEAARLTCIVTFRPDTVVTATFGVGAPLTNVAPPSITGTAVTDSVLTADPGSWSVPPTALSYQWLRDGREIPDATAPTYRLQSDDLGTHVRVAVTASADGHLPATSSSSAMIVERAALTGTRPKIRGRLSVGRALAVLTGRWTPSAQISLQWYAEGRPIAGATEVRLRLTRSMRGQRIAVRAVGTKPGYVRLVLRSSRSRPVR